ncbi:MAG TPA: amidohydrolase/deacetylase family metallohydrolase [Pararhizobium sp.]|nr:amidohydrolase/deacetylase family metallohydrolase [Pararhizobium sp.]
MSIDLIIRGGRLIDPAAGVDEKRDVAIRDGRVIAVESSIPADNAAKVIEAKDCIVTPGLIDLHSHVYWGGTSLGVDADRIATRSGTTTYVDAGSAGAGNFLGFRCHVIERSKVRILAYLNISFAGIFGFSRNVMVGECADLRLCDPREAVACAHDHADLIVGVKVRSGRIAGGNSGIAPVDLAIEAADKLQLPLMAHIDEPPPGRSEVLGRLRRGDILTHCFRPFPNAPVDGAGRIRSDMLAARERGIVFDIGHGMGSFDFDVAETMIGEGFLPDVISSDMHLFSVDGPAFDLLVCLSKLICLGMPIAEVIRAATERPAQVIGRGDLGTLEVGSAGDVSVLRLREGEFPYCDSNGSTSIGKQRLTCDGIAVGGKWIPNEEPAGPGRLEGFTPVTRCNHADVVKQHFPHLRRG